MAKNNGDSLPVDSLRSKREDELKEEIKELEEKIKQSGQELSECLEYYQKKNIELSKCREEKNKLKAEFRDLKSLLDKKKDECEELRTKLTEVQTQVKSLNDALNDKCSVIKNQGDKISEIEKNLLERNKEITDLTDLSRLRTEERDVSLKEQKELNSKMDWLIDCLSKEAFPSDADQEDNGNSGGDSENETKLNLIFNLARKYCSKLAIALMAHDELEKGVSDAFQKYINKLNTGVREIFKEDDQLSNLTTRFPRRYSEVTNANVKTNRTSGGASQVETPEISLSSSAATATTIQITSASADNGNVLGKHQFPVLAANSLPSPLSPTQPPGIQSPIESEESEHDISTGFDSEDDDIAETKKKHKSAEKKKPTGNEEVVMHGFPCQFCKATFRVPGVLHQHVTSKHTSFTKKTAKRRLSVPPSSSSEKSAVTEDAKKSKIIGGYCPECKKAFPSLAQLKMHLRKEHKTNPCFDVFIPLDHCDTKKSTRDSCQNEEVETSSDPQSSTSLPVNNQQKNSTANEQSPGTPVVPAIENQEEEGITEKVVHGKSLKNNVCLCRRKFKNESRLKQHITLMNKKKNFECTKCTLKFAYARQLYAHFPVAHPDNDDDGGGAMMDVSNDDDRGSIMDASNDDDVILCLLNDNDGGVMMDVSNEGDHDNDHVPVDPQLHPESTMSNGNGMTGHDETDTGNKPEENDENTLRGLEGVTGSHNGDDRGGDENNINSTNKGGDGTGSDDGNSNSENVDSQEVDIECLSSPEQNKLKCCWCPLTFSVEFAAQAHAKSVHQGELAIAVKAENGGNFACQTCFQTFETEQEVQEHLSSNHLTNVQA